VTFSMVARDAASGAFGAVIRSAGLSVINGSGWRVTDLRVDWSDDPLADLTALLDVWLPQRDAYITRALNPAAAPSYGIPGDELSTPAASSVRSSLIPRSGSRGQR
jgi:uncharacterized Ntn-hydrolase superfamily protein